ncbi:MAG TPA: hypothetical protein VHP63_07075, partial [candidate division Zixibacteria bacterium]|nr:hypothetical protein [candidate division Zixibacteria bacterium]
IQFLLREKQADENLINNIIGVINQCDFARFATSSMTRADMDATLAKVEEIMAGIEAVRFE